MTSRIVRTGRKVLGVALVLAVVAGASGCATRRPETMMPPAPVSAGIVWKVEPYDVLKTKVYRQPDLSTESVVATNGTAFFPGIGRVAVSGMSSDSLEALLNTRYGTIVRDPAVQVTLQREVTVYGQLRSPGIYTVDPNSTLLNLTARGGGQTGADAPSIVLETAKGERFSLPREARLGTLDIHRQDAILLSEQSFFLKNAASIGATQVVVTSLTALIGLITILSR